jgi:hypothetical protein
MLRLVPLSYSLAPTPYHLGFCHHVIPEFLVKSQESRTLNLVKCIGACGTTGGIKDYQKELTAGPIAA